MKYRTGFTLIETIVVVAVVGILASVVSVSFSESSKKSRDAQRKADLRTMQAAIELYKQEYGRYPEGCNDDPSNWAGVWSGEVGSDYDCPGGSAEYILNDLSATTEIENFAPKFIQRLPVDPKKNGSNSGYVYTTNPEGTVYKFMALNTVEIDIIPDDAATAQNPFARCGDMTTTAGECTTTPNDDSGGGVGYMNNGSGGPPEPACNIGEYGNDYAVWGGYAPGGGSPYRDLPKAREFYSDTIRCK